MAEEKRMKAKKGRLVVLVGLEEEGEGGEGRFEIPISYLCHPLFKKLLDTAHEVYGYHAAGPLRLPCTVDDFVHLRWLIEREFSQSNGYHDCPRSQSFSLSSC